MPGSFVKITLLLGMLLLSCAPRPVKREIYQTSEISKLSADKKYLKCHMKDGTVYILSTWVVNEDNGSLSGYGSLLDINRNTLESRENVKKRKNETPFIINLDDVALFETNDSGPKVTSGLWVVTGITLGFTFFCILSPKTCFGSCPTFYAYNGDTLELQAEGFSSSVAPSLEKNDIDMFYHVSPNKDFELIVTNEALETHSIRYANLLVFPKADNERIFSTPEGDFYKTQPILTPSTCKNEDGDLLDMVIKADGYEYFSPADSNDLNTKEEILISFEIKENQRTGLVIGKRQTLLTTYLMYQGLAYMGNSVSYWIAQMERGQGNNKAGIFDLLGGIEVYSKNTEGIWEPEGLINETGPIATDFNIVPISQNHTGTLELKLKCTKGLWRIDYLALALIKEKVKPALVQPYEAVRITGSEDYPLEKLIHDDEHLVTLPGDQYRLKYQLPFENSEIFLDSKGFYLEWIRDTWIQEQNFKKLRIMAQKPERFLRMAAPEYKKLEPIMEETFWNSKYVKK